MLKKIIYSIIILELIIKLILFINNKPVYITEFFINYQEGFVRRGLLGEIFLFISKIFSFDIFNLHLIIAFICILFTWSYIIIKLRKSEFDTYILLASYLIVGIITSEIIFLFKLDIFLIVLFIFQIEWSKRITDYTKLILVSISFLFIGTLIHEVYFLFSILPTIFILNKSKFKRNNFRTLLIFLPTFFLFFLMITYYKGNNINVNSMIEDYNLSKNYSTDIINYLKFLFNSKTEFLIWKMKIFNDKPFYYFGLLFNILIIFSSLLIYLKSKLVSKNKEVFLLVTVQY